MFGPCIGTFWCTNVVRVVIGVQGRVSHKFERASFWPDLKNFGLVCGQIGCVWATLWYLTHSEMFFWPKFRPNWPCFLPYQRCQGGYRGSRIGFPINLREPHFGHIWETLALFVAKLAVFGLLCGISHTQRCSFCPNLGQIGRVFCYTNVVRVVIGVKDRISHKFERASFWPHLSNWSAITYWSAIKYWSRELHNSSISSLETPVGPICSLCKRNTQDPLIFWWILAVL